MVFRKSIRMSLGEFKRGTSGLAAGILIAGFLLTFGSTFFLRQSLEASAQRDFEVDAQAALRRIDARLQSYIALLRGGAALFAVDSNVNRAEWSRYVRRLRVEETYPGVQGLGFSRRVPSDQVPMIEAFMKDQGLDDFRIWPMEPARDEYHSILYLEPDGVRNRAALGFDMFSEEIRRAAMQRAWAEGHAAASGKVELVQEIVGPKQAGFLIYVPVFEGGARPATVEERQNQLLGFVYSPFRAGDLIEAVMADDPLPITLKVYDGSDRSPASQIFPSPPDESETRPDGRRLALPLNLAGRTWTVELTGPPARRLEPTLLFLVPTSGGTLTLLLAFLALREARSRQRAERTAQELKERGEQLRAAQGELARHAAELEQKVVERTRRLSETIGELEAFSYSISHDLRAPLRAMNAFARIVVEDSGDKLDAESRSHLDRIVAASARMDQLITDVLAYSRVARTEIRLEPISVRELLREVIHQYPALQEPHATVILQEPFDIILAEGASLIQSLSNLMTNAAKFVAPGVKPRIVVRMERREDQRRIWVEDNGIGIPPEHLHRIFGMFERLNPQAAYDGTGIGLAIVKKAVQRMNGALGVESELGKGSRFWIQLPAA